MTGRIWARAGMICAALSLFLAPVVFGQPGISSGTVAVWKEDRWWGAAGVSGSFVAAVVKCWGRANVHLLKDATKHVMTTMPGVYAKSRIENYGLPL